MSRKKDDSKAIAKERIERLFELAERSFPVHPERSDSNVALARKIAMRHRVRLPRTLRDRFCKNCHKYLKPNVNCKVSVSNGSKKIECFACGNVMKRRDSG